MGLLDILTQLGQATAERARAKEFGADYRQRWQESADKHTLSETQNALSQENLKSKVRETENLYMVAKDLYPDLSPDQALARMESDRVRRTVEGEQLDITGKKQGLRFGETAEQRAAAQAGRQEQLFPIQLQGAQQGVEFGKTKQEREQVELDRIRAGKEPVPTYHNEPGSFMPIVDMYGNIKGAWNAKSGRYEEAPNPGMRKTPIPPAETKALSQFNTAEAALNKIEQTLGRVEKSSWTSPVEKSLALAQFKADAQGLGGMALGRAVGEVGVFTNQDREVYSTLIAPSLTVLATGDIGTDEARKRISEVRAWIRDSKQKAAQRYQQRYGAVPDELGGDAGSPQIGERKTFPNGRIGVWDGRGWKAQ